MTLVGTWPASAGVALAATLVTQWMARDGRREHRLSVPAPDAARRGRRRERAADRPTSD